MMRENPNVRRFNTQVALSVLKRGLNIPIPLSDASTSPGAE
jgi:Lrp/AsnC family leucine-responsive transcriptional regulator